MAEVLPVHARVLGLDKEPAWVAAAQRRARKLGLDDRFEYQVGDAERLPFASDSFDMVTCQTLLIHLHDVSAVLREMLRVLKPGGLLTVAEPNNQASMLVMDSVQVRQPVQELLESIGCFLICQRGKERLGEGNNSVGDLVPGEFARIGVEDIRVYLSDKAEALIPPYGTDEERALLTEYAQDGDMAVWAWDRDTTYRYYCAGGGTPAAFERAWAQITKTSEATRRAIGDGTCHTAGGNIMYVISGRKAAAASGLPPNRRAGESAA